MRRGSSRPRRRHRRLQDQASGVGLRIVESGTMATTSVTDEVRNLEAQRIVQTYRRQPLTLVRGEGVRLFDAEGREYFDLLSGIGVASLGHAHPRLAAALAEQARTLL